MEEARHETADCFFIFFSPITILLITVCTQFYYPIMDKIKVHQATRFMLHPFIFKRSMGHQSTSDTASRGLRTLTHHLSSINSRTGSGICPSIIGPCTQRAIALFISALEKKIQCIPGGSHNFPERLVPRAPERPAAWLQQMDASHCFMKLPLNVCRTTFSHSIPPKRINSFHTHGGKR